MRIGVLGLGFGLHLAQTLANRDDVELVAVADRSTKRDVMAIAQSYGAQGFLDGVEMVQNANLEALVIATPPHTRDDVVNAALQKDLPVFIEKPIAATPRQAMGLMEKCQRGRVMVGFSFRFHRPVQHLLAEVAGKLGPGKLLNGSYIFNWLPPAENWLWDRELGGGFFNENSCHLFDVVVALMGRPSEIFAMGFEAENRPSAAGAALTLRFGEQAIGALTIGGVGAGIAADFPKLDLVCANGTARLSGHDHMWTRLEWSYNDSTEAHIIDYAPERLGRTRYSDAFDHFIDAVANNKPFAATLGDGLTTVEMADAVYRAISTNKAVTL